MLPPNAPVRPGDGGRAGREMDALVAERVMGAEWKSAERLPGSVILMLPGHRWALAQRFEDESVIHYDAELPNYSTNITDAFLVVEKIRNVADAPDQTYWTLVDCSQLGWRASIERVLTENDGPALIAGETAETLPEAICKAALAAVTSPSDCGVPTSA